MPSSYVSAVLADAPLHYWRMADPGGGIAHDLGSSPVHVHGLGTSISQPLGYSGPISDGGSMDLCLDGQYANTGINITVPMNAFSLEVLYWNWQQLGTLGYIYQVQTANQVALYRDGTNWHFLYNGASVTTNHNYTAQAWHHVVATYDGTNMRLYVDAFAAGPTAVAAQANLSTLFEISTSQALTSWGHGFFAECAVYGSALSSGRVNAHFAAISSPTMVPVYSQAAGSPAGGSSPDLSAVLAAVSKTFTSP